MEGYLLKDERYHSRLSGVVSESIRSKRIVQVGCGAGSLAATCLARSGVGSFGLVDPDIVAIENLCRTAYNTDQVGMSKVEALANLMRLANPSVDVSTLACDVTELEDSAVVDLMTGADLLIAGTDSLEAQALLNVWSLRFRVPTVFIGIHSGGTGGRVIWSVPGKTACYRCLSRARYESARDAVDLAGENGSIFDAVFVDMVAMRVAMAILDRGEASRLGRFFEAMQWRTEVVVRNHLDHAYTQILRAGLKELVPKNLLQIQGELDQALQCSLDTLWLPTESDPECPDCLAWA